METIASGATWPQYGVDPEATDTEGPGGEEDLGPPPKAEAALPEGDEEQEGDGGNHQAGVGQEVDANPGGHHSDRPPERHADEPTLAELQAQLAAWDDRIAERTGKAAEYKALRD